MRSWFEYKITSLIAFLLIFLFILPIGYMVWGFWKNTISEIDASGNIKINSTQSISKSEKTQIDNWILKNNLNKYGDPVGTMYAGGTPLFDESTGKTLDLYQYILKNHLDRPWKK